MADRILQHVTESRRGFVKRLLGTAFAAPVIASFSVEALSSSIADAQTVSNQTDNQCSTAGYIYGSGLWEGPLYCAEPVPPVVPPVV